MRAVLDPRQVDALSSAVRLHRLQGQALANVLWALGALGRLKGEHLQEQLQSCWVLECSGCGWGVSRASRRLLGEERKATSEGICVSLASQKHPGPGGTKEPPTGFMAFLARQREPPNLVHASSDSHRHMGHDHRIVGTPVICFFASLFHDRRDVRSQQEIGESCYASI